METIRTEIKLAELKKMFKEKFPEGEYWKEKSHYSMAYEEYGKVYNYYSCSTLRDFFCRILELSNDEIERVWLGWRY